MVKGANTFSLLHISRRTSLLVTMDEGWDPIDEDCCLPHGLENLKWWERKTKRRLGT